MKAWIGLAALGICLAVPSAAEINVSNLPQSIRAQPVADEPIQGVPVRTTSASAELDQFLRNLKAAAPANDEFSSALKKAAVRPAAPGVYEVDLDPEGAKFTSPDLAALQDGQILFDYVRLGKDASLLQQADVHSWRGHFYRNGVEIAAFEAFSRLALEDFIGGFTPALAPPQREQLRTLAEIKAVVPLSIEASGEQWLLKLFDAKTKRLRRLPAGLTRQAPGFLECFQALKDYSRPS